jgi:hypothetical protein
MDAQVVAHVVAPVHEGRRERGVHPDRIDTEPLQVVQPRDDPPQIADPVAVGVAEAARVDLVEEGVVEP